MINKSISDKSQINDIKEQIKDKKPDEKSGVYFSSHVKIYDPNTKEVFVQKRADD